MMIWIAIAVMICAFLAASWLYLRRMAQAQILSEEQQALLLYANQLGQLEAEQNEQSIDAEQAEQAKFELKRRMLRLSRQSKARAAQMGKLTKAAPEQQVSAHNRQLALMLGIFVLAASAAVGAYLLLGSADMPSYAYQERLQAARTDDYAMQAHNIERQIVQQQNSLDAVALSDLWAQASSMHLLSLKAQGMIARDKEAEKAVGAMQKAVMLDIKNPEKHIQFAGLILELTQGQPVPQLAVAAVQKAYELAPDNPSVFFYMGIIALRNERPDVAQQAFSAVLEQVQSDPELVVDIRKYLLEAEQMQQRLASQPQQSAPTSSAPAGPSAEDVANAATMSEQERNEMISGMVANLAQRLADNPQDVEGWRRLINAYKVLNREQERREAIAALMAQLPDKQSAEYLSLQRELESE